MTKLYLAPMEGVVDWVMRDMLTRIGGIDQCVTEFMRITDQLMPDHVFYRYSPELKTNSKTLSGVPVFFQLLGGQPGPMAENAAKVAGLGAIGIDLNFGCPAKTVNRHDGGAAILKSPDRVFKIVEAVRKAVPAHIPVTAKIRLGYDNPADCLENAKAAEAGGAEWLTVHCRTKTDAYKPPAYWEWIPKIKEVTKIKIIANGEVSDVESFKKCKEISACDDIMIGRAAIGNPFLFREIKKYLAAEEKSSLLLEKNWREVQNLLPGFFKMNTDFKSEYFAQARTKQMLRQMCLHFEEAVPAFEDLKVFTEPKKFYERLETYC